MKISDFKDSIIRDRQRGATYQAIADRFDCSRQYIEQLLTKWDAKEVLVPSKQDRARQALQLIIDGKEPTIGKAAYLHRVSQATVSRVAKDDGVDLQGLLKRNRAKARAHYLDGQQFNGLKIVDGTCFLHENRQLCVEAICVVCGTRKTFQVNNLQCGYTKTCSIKCGWRYRKGDYPKG
jgi:transposase-like protein|tara:strand:- start:3 stop:539 length:537 start_codon:yes stop_codon:yes gene_type:complete